MKNLIASISILACSASAFANTVNYSGTNSDKRSCLVAMDTNPTETSVNVDGVTATIDLASLPVYTENGAIYSAVGADQSEVSVFLGFNSSGEMQSVKISSRETDQILKECSKLVQSAAQ